MNKKVFLLTLSFLGSLVLTIAAWAIDTGELSDVTITNSTKNDFDYLFISPQDTDVWGPDLLGASGSLAVNASRVISLSNANDKDKYDLLAVDTSGNRFEAELTVLQGKPLTFKVTQKLAKGKFESTFQEVTVVNNTKNRINYLFFSSDKSEIWGADLLGETTQLENGDSHVFHIPIYDDNGVKFNVMGVDEDGNEYQVDVTAAGTEDPLKVTLNASDRSTSSDDSSSDD